MSIPFKMLLGFQYAAFIHLGVCSRFGGVIRPVRISHHPYVCDAEVASEVLPIKLWEH